MKVECGTPLDSVASGLGVSAEQVRSWYEDLKKLLYLSGLIRLNKSIFALLSLPRVNRLLFS